MQWTLVTFRVCSEALVTFRVCSEALVTFRVCSEHWSPSEYAVNTGHLQSMQWTLVTFRVCSEHWSPSEYAVRHSSSANSKPCYFVSWASHFYHLMDFTKLGERPTILPTQTLKQNSRLSSLRSIEDYLGTKFSFFKTAVPKSMKLGTLHRHRSPSPEDAPFIWYGRQFPSRCESHSGTDDWRACRHCDIFLSVSLMFCEDLEYSSQNHQQGTQFLKAGFG